MIARHSLPGGNIDTAGSVRFQPLGHDRGTEVRISLKYNAPGGKVGAMIATLSGRGLMRKIVEDLRKLKRRFETGEIPTGGSGPDRVKARYFRFAGERAALEDVAFRPQADVRSMKAVCWHGKEDIRVESVPDPQVLNPHDAVNAPQRLQTFRILGQLTGRTART